MVYLFEDREIRMNGLLENEIVSDFFCHAKFEGQGIELNTYFEENFSDAMVVLFHRSYNIGKHTLPNLKNVLGKRGVEFIQFSGDFQNFFSGRAISSERMYRNLRAFIDDYEKKQEPKIEILFFGINYLKNELLGLKYKIANFFSEDKEFLDKKRLIELWEFLDDNIVISDLKEEKEGVLKQIKGLEDGSSKPSEDVKKIIINWIEKYE